MDFFTCFMTPSAMAILFRARPRSKDAPGHSDFSQDIVTAMSQVLAVPRYGSLQPDLQMVR